MLSNFHSRMLLVFVGLVMLAEVGTTLAVMHAARRSAYGMAEQQLVVADKLVQEVVAVRHEEYRSSLQALASDFAFREAIASRDAPTIGSALANHGARVSADLVALIDNAGEITHSTDSTLEAAPPTALLDAFGYARLQPQTPVLILLNGKLLQVVVVPVRAPDTIAWVGMGFTVRDYIVGQLKQTTGVDISLLVDAAVTTSTLTDRQREILGAAKAMSGVWPSARPMRFGDQDYVSLAEPVSGIAGSEVLAVLQIPEATVIAPLLALRRDLVRWGGLVTIVCLCASLLSARVLTRPVTALANAARSLRVAKRDAAVETSESELSSLTSAVHTLAHRTQYDALTGLPNRTLFAEWLAVSVARAEREHTPLAVVILDLDDFRQINESSGHAMGDLVLRKVAQRLLRTMRPADMVARLGGDQFALALEGVGQTAASKVVDRVARALTKPMQSPAGVLQVAVRAGIAVLPDHARDLDTLMRLADTAMHQSKALNERTVVAKMPSADAHLNTAETINRMSAMHDMFGATQWGADDLSTQPLKTIDESDAALVDETATPRAARGQ